MTGELGDLRAFASGLRNPQRNAVIEAAENFNVKWMAGLMRLQASKHLTIEDTVELFQLMVNLNKAAGRGLEQDDQYLARLVWYPEKGLHIPFPET